LKSQVFKNFIELSVPFNWLSGVKDHSEFVQMKKGGVKGSFSLDSVGLITR
jgi:hypothetical protein